MSTIIIGWSAGGNSGWGWYGANLLRFLARAGRQVSVPAMDWSTLPPEWRLEGWAPSPVPAGPADIYFGAFGNAPIGHRIQNGHTKSYAVIFFEDTHIDAARVEALNSYDGVICGSTWNAELLKAAGVERVHTVLQGADCDGEPIPPDHTPQRARRIFSGGKLEFRKGQDIVLAAFRDYLKSDPDAVLVTAWQNHWPATMKGIDAMGYVKGLPPLRSDGSADIVAWAVKNGVPARNIVDVGMPSTWALQRVIKRCDVAVFPNRAEGGHNLVAAECLAAGVRVSATKATGQANLAPYGAYGMHWGNVTARCPLYRAMDEWAETTVASAELAMHPPAVRSGPNLHPPTWAESCADLWEIIKP